MEGALGQLGRSFSATSYCCDQLANALGSKIAFPSNVSYVTTQDSYWSLQEADLSPTCIVIPETATDVAKSVSILVKSPDCHFAIKGQTHAPAAGFANINAGITIDTTSLDAITINADHSIVSIGAGAPWIDVYRFLDALTLSVAGGRNGAVGVAGLTLGGGISYFGPRVGWACDNAVNFEIALASGKLVNANASSHADLFKALKGGASNFGIVTRVDLRPFAQGDMLAGSLVYNISQRTDVFQVFAHFADSVDYDVYASLVLGLLFDATSKVWSVNAGTIYTKPVTNPPVYDDFFNIPPVENKLYITNLSSYAAEEATPPLNWLFYTGTYGVSAAFLDAMFDSMNATLYDFNIPEGVTWSIALEPLPTVMTKYGALNGGNSLGVSPAQGNQFILLLSALWPDTASNSVVEQISQEIGQNVAQIAKAKGLLKEFQYSNYADPSQNPLGSYGQQNLAALNVVSKKYDPQGVFQKQSPGGFKLEKC